MGSLKSKNSKGVLWAASLARNQPNPHPMGDLVWSQNPQVMVVTGTFSAGQV